MSARYVDVPADVLIASLLAAGFVRDPSSGSEEVFYREHAKAPAYAVRVYTSLSQAARRARGCGEDAIRVVVTYEGPNGRRGVWKARRVHRAGSVDAVIARMLDRMRDGYRHINGLLMNPRYRSERSERSFATQRVAEAVNPLGGGS